MDEEKEIELIDITADLYGKINEVTNMIKDKGFAMLICPDSLRMHKIGESRIGDSFKCLNLREVEIYLKGHSSGQYDSGKKHERDK